jgi:hypothetical protein
MKFADMMDKAKQAMGKHPDKTRQGIDRAGEYAKGRFGHEQQVDSASDRAKGYVGQQNQGAQDQPSQQGQQGGSPENR